MLRARPLLSSILVPSLISVRRLAAAGLLILACLPAATAAAQDPPRVAESVGAGGVDLSGLTLDEATAKLSARLGPRLAKPVVVLAAGRRFTLAASDAKVTLDARTTAKRALAAAKPSTTPQAGGTAFGADVPLAIRHSRLAVRAFSQQVSAAVARPGRDASLEIGLKTLRLHRARLGIALDATALAADVDATLDAPATSRLIRSRVAKVSPPVNADDIRAQYRTVVTVSKREFKLRLFKNLKLRRTFPVAVGQPAYPTPEGRFHIQDKQVDPVWSVPHSPWAGELAGTTVAGGSAANPLKARWMGIANGVGIHGTGEDWSIGSAASHGCVRMHVADVKRLYPLVPVGATVLIR